MNLFLFLSVPAGLMVLIGLPSLSIGMLFFFFSYAILHIKNIINNFDMPRSYIHFLVIASVSIALNVIPPYDISFLTKSIFSFLILIFFFIGASFFINNLSKMLDSENINVIRNAYIILIFVGLMGLSGLQPSSVGIYSQKLVFPFLEPSHFTIAFSLISTTMLCILKNNLRPYILISTLFFALLFPSTLCLAIFMMQVLLVVSSSRSFWGLLIFLIIFSPLIFIILDLDYYLTRIVGGAEDAVNLTNLVYLQGWESIITSFKESYGLGLGFQMMGREYSGPLGEILCEDYYFCANNLDGSFLSAKIITEFGIIGALITCLALYMSFKSMILLRKHISNADRNLKGFFNSEVFGLVSLYVFSAELLLRGYGYFSPTFLIAMYFIYLPFKLSKTS